MYTSWFSSTPGLPQHPVMPGSIQATWFLELSWFHCLLAAFDGAVKPAFFWGDFCQGHPGRHAGVTCL